MKKNYEDYLIYGLLALVIIVLVFSIYSYSKVQNPIIEKSNKITDTNKERNAFSSVSTGGTDSGNVLIELTPHKVINGKFVVDIAVNTHSVDLTQFNLKEITTLEYEGNTITPTSAPLLKGHHNSGEIVFDIGKELTKFTIKIKGIPNVEDRLFSW